MRTVWRAPEIKAEFSALGVISPNLALARSNVRQRERPCKHTPHES